MRGYINSQRGNPGITHGGGVGDADKNAVQLKCGNADDRRERAPWQISLSRRAHAGIRSHKVNQDRPADKYSGGANQRCDDCKLACEFDRPAKARLAFCAICTADSGFGDMSKAVQNQCDHIDKLQQDVIARQKVCALIGRLPAEKAKARGQA